MTDFRHTNGHVAELYCAYRLAKLNWKISFPHTSQSRYDLIGDVDGKFYRLQVKKASWSKAGPYKYLQCRLINKCSGKHYLPEEVDYMVITDLETVWLMPIKDASEMTSVCLGSTNPDYKQYKKYDSNQWIIE